MRSSTLDEKFVLANSPSDDPSPVKSKRSTPTPAAARLDAIRLAANMSLVQVKQWAKSANARGGPDGRSRRALSSLPALPLNEARIAEGFDGEGAIASLILRCVLTAEGYHG